MASKLGKQIDNHFDLLYEDPAWLCYIRDLLGSNVNMERVIVSPVEPGDAYRFSGDLYAYLRYKGIPSEYDHIHLVLNKMTTPAEFTEETQVVYIYEATSMMEAINRFNSAETKKEDP